MKTEKTARLQYLVHTVPALLQNIPDTDFSRKIQQDKWSKKEILGHLIDSATHNHHRFVRCQFEETPAITYPQEQWNRYSGYQQLEKQHLIDFWTLYNRHLAVLVAQIPQENHSRLCATGGPTPLTLAAVFDDYVNHLEHHLAQILG